MIQKLSIKILSKSNDTQKTKSKNPALKKDINQKKESKNKKITSLKTKIKI
jgi:hypothetical protein